MILTTISTLLCAAQAYYMSLIIFKYIKKNIIEILCDALTLVHILIIASLPTISSINRQYGIVDVYNYSMSMHILVPILLLISLIAFFGKRNNLYLLIAVSAVLTHPIVENIDIRAYAIAYYLFLGISAYRLFRCISIAFIEHKSVISPLSIRNGLDNLHTGIMFYGADGYIYLSNKKMQTIMYRFYNKDFRNAHTFWHTLTREPLQDAEKFTVNKDIAIRTAEDTLYFSKRHFTIGKKEYIELIASDVSKIDKDLVELEKQKQELLVQEKHIYSITKSMKKLKKEQEIAELQYHVHDIMAQQLTAVQRMLHTDGENYNAVIPLLQDMIKDIKNSYSPTIHQSFTELREYFNKLGVEIQACELFPETSNYTHLFLSIIREATTNAIRHANASKIFLSLSLENSTWTMKITNNGKTPQKSITEGWGLSGIRKRVESAGGTLSIESIPEFSISIQVKENNSIDYS